MYLRISFLVNITLSEVVILFVNVWYQDNCHQVKKDKSYYKFVSSHLMKSFGERGRGGGEQFPFLKHKHIYSLI